MMLSSWEGSGKGRGSGGNASNGEQQMKLPRLPPLTSCYEARVPNSLWTGTGSGPRDWGPLSQ